MEQYINDPASTLNGGITNSQTSVVVTSATGYPTSGNFRIRVESELMLVTAVSGSTFTVTRGIEGTTAVSHLTGSVVNASLTAAALTAIISQEITIFDVVFAYIGIPVSGATVFFITFSRPITFAANFAGSYGHVGTNPTATATFTVLKNGSSAGSIAFSTSGTSTFTTTGGTTLVYAAGDVMSITAPNPQDASMQNIAITFAGTR